MTGHESYITFLNLIFTLTFLDENREGYEFMGRWHENGDW